MTIPRNILLLYAARGVRGFGDGFATITLPAYLIAIGYDPVRIGLVVAASLLGTAVLTLAIGAIASRHDLRTLMLLGALLMMLTGLAFPNFRQHRRHHVHRLCRLDQSVERRSRRAGAARAGHAGRQRHPTKSAPAPSRAIA